MPHISFIRTYARFLFITISIFFLARLGTFTLLSPEMQTHETKDIFYSLYIGLKFDARLAVFCSLPLALVMFIPAFERRLDCLWSWLLWLYAAIFATVILIYAVDIAFLLYLNKHVDAYALTLLSNNTIALSLLWQTYPIIWIALGLLALLAVAVWCMALLLWNHKPTQHLGFRQRTLYSFFAIALVLLIGHGQITCNLLPLQLSDAYFTPKKDLTILAINPVLNMIDTYNAPQNIEQTMPAPSITPDTTPNTAAEIVKIPE